MKPKRNISIDVFRGFTIFMMVFVNDLAGVSDIPAWMKHVAADADSMTFVDVVFPAFLFIVGMAIPLAVQNRLVRNPDLLAFWKHVGIRTFGLLVLGVYMVNAAEMNSEASLISKSWWSVLLYSAAILIWNRYNKIDGLPYRRNMIPILRLTGLIILIVLYFLYRKGSEDKLMGMTPSWWGILGLIGWAYLYSVVIYMGSKRLLVPVLGMAFLLMMMVLGIQGEELSLPACLSWLSGQAGNFCHTFITLIGIIVSLLLLDQVNNSTKLQKIRNILFMAVLLAIGGYFVRSFGGISKIYATPSWALFSCSICCIVYVLLFWIVDVNGQQKWFTILKPAGENPLLTYILPFIFYAIAGFNYLPDIFNSGLLGFIRAILFSLFILFVAGVLTRKGIRLHL